MILKGQSQDGVLGGPRIHVSSQLGHLADTSGVPRTLKGMGGTPSDQVGRGADIENGLEDMGRGKGKLGQSERVTLTYIHYQT